MGWGGNGWGGGEEAAWLPVGERNSRKRFLPRKKPLMNSSSGNGFNGSLGKTINVSVRVLYPPFSTNFKVKFFFAERDEDNPWVTRILKKSFWQFLVGNATWDSWLRLRCSLRWNVCLFPTFDWNQDSGTSQLCPLKSKGQQIVDSWWCIFPQRIEENIAPLRAK